MNSGGNGIAEGCFADVVLHRDLGSPETVIIHVGTNDMRTTRNLDFIMGEVYTMCIGVYGKEETSELQTYP